MHLKKSILAISVALMSTDTFAAAFQLAEHSSSGLGRAYAGEAAIAENASVVARNPALMTQFDSTELSFSAIYIKPDVSLEGTSTTNGQNPNVLDDDSIAPEAFVPGAYAVIPLNDRVSLGFGMHSNFGLSTEFADDYAAGQLAGNTEIITVNTNVSVGYKFNDQWSLGFGINYVYADATVERNFGYLPEGVLPITPPASTQVAHLEGDDYATGWNLGVSYDLDEANRFGLHYRSEVNLDFTGEYSNQLPPALGGLGGQTVPGALDLTLPAIAEFSGTHQLNDKAGLHYSIQWTGWSSFQELSAFVPGSEDPVFSKKENFSNAWRFALGGDYQVSDAVKLRAGLAYDESPAPADHLSISIPDTDRYWVSFGANWVASENIDVDFGFSALMGKTQNFTEADGLGNQWGFESKGDAYLAGLQLNYRF